MPSRVVSSVRSASSVCTTYIDGSCRSARLLTAGLLYGVAPPHQQQDNQARLRPERHVSSSGYHDRPVTDPDESGVSVSTPTCKVRTEAGPVIPVPFPLDIGSMVGRQKTRKCEIKRCSLAGQTAAEISRKEAGHAPDRYVDDGQRKRGDVRAIIRREGSIS